MSHPLFYMLQVTNSLQAKLYCYFASQLGAFNKETTNLKKKKKKGIIYMSLHTHTQHLTV